VNWKLQVARGKPFGRIAPRIQEIGRPELQPLSVYLELGVVPRADRDDNHNRLGADLSKYQVVHPGDVVFNKLRTWQGGFGVSKHEGLVSPAYFVCRPIDEIEPRWLGYVLRSNPYLAELTRISKWMPPSQFDIAWPDLNSLKIAAPRRSKQRAIADFLDTETTRIDSLITLRSQVAKVTDERFRAFLTSQVESLELSVAPLGRFVRSLTQGVSPVADQAPADGDEWGVLKLSAVRFGRFRPTENKRLPSDFGFDAALVPKPGDLLVTRANTPGYVGDACAVGPYNGRVVVSDLIYLLRLDSYLDPEFAAINLLCARGRTHMSGYARGTSQSMVKLRGEDIKACLITVADRGEQAELAKFVQEQRFRADGLISAMIRQVDLLSERKQALITAAVTGQLDLAREIAEEAS
jgi:type I restriction enzyme, S subunit